MHREISFVIQSPKETRLSIYHYPVSEMYPPSVLDYLKAFMKAYKLLNNYFISGNHGPIPGKYTLYLEGVTGVISSLKDGLKYYLNLEEKSSNEDLTLVLYRLFMTELFDEMKVISEYKGADHGTSETIGTTTTSTDGTTGLESTEGTGSSNSVG